VSLNLKFRWSDVRGEGFINKTDAARLLEEDWITAADFLVDVIHDARNLYDKVLTKSNTNKTVCRAMVVLGHDPKKAKK
jgi:hypothetical protein